MCSAKSRMTPKQKGPRHKHPQQDPRGFYSGYIGIILGLYWAIFGLY